MKFQEWIFRKHEEKKTKWRCPKGHEWEGSSWVTVIAPNGREYKGLCLECLIEWLEANFGKIEKI